MIVEQILIFLMNNGESEIELLIGQIHKIKTNLKKAPFRKYLKFTLDEKLRNVKLIYKNITDLLLENEARIGSSHFNFLIKAARQEFDETLILLNTKLKHYKKSVSCKSVVYAVIFNNLLKKCIARNVTTMPFDIKTATSIVQVYDGTSENLDAYVDSANLLKDYVAADQVATAVRFLKTRLTGKARLGLAENLNTIDALIDDVKQRCAEQITPANIIAKLKTTKQKGDTNNFCDEIDKLTNKLKSIYVGQGIPDGVAKTMATKAGVDALINGTTSYETKIILKAGTFSNINEAVQKVQENATPTAANQQNSSQIMTYGTHKHNNHTRNNRGRRERNQNAQRGRHTYHRYQGHFLNRTPQNYGFNRGGRRDQRPRQMFVTNAEQIYPMPQNMPRMQNLPQQIPIPTAGQPQNVNFLGQANQGPSPQQQFIR